MEGEVPKDLCSMRIKGELLSFATDCTPDDLKVQCSCCTNCKIDLNGGDNFSPGLDSRGLAIMVKLKLLSGNAVADESTPQHKAAHWIMKQDEMMLTSDSPQLYQRYVLALMYELGDETCFERSEVDECHWVSNGDAGVTWERIACDSNGVVEYLKLGTYTKTSKQSFVQ